MAEKKQKEKQPEEVAPEKEETPEEKLTVEMVIHHHYQSFIEDRGLYPNLIVMDSDTLNVLEKKKLVKNDTKKKIKTYRKMRIVVSVDPGIIVAKSI